MILYAPSHEYIRVEGNTGFIGISEYAAHQLGNIVYVDMPEQGDDVEAGEEFGAVESVKAASDLYAPASGAVIAINEELFDNPRLINEDPMKNWIIQIELSNPDELSGLLDEKAYAELCKAEEENK